MTSFRTTRDFQLWSFDVTHGQLLFRSQKDTDGTGSQVDVLFFGVNYLSCAWQVEGFGYSETTASEAERLLQPAGVRATADDTVFRIIGVVGGFVVARGVRTVETNDDYWVPSPLTLTLPEFDASVASEFDRRPRDNS